MLTRQSIDKLTELLALPATGFEQDWEVELADSGRIDDFVSAYGASNFEPADRLALMALILASVDLFIAKEGRLPGSWTQISQLLTEESHLHAETLSYWCCVGETDPDCWFHLTPHVRSLKFKAEKR